ncbi:hypothetical protein Vid5_gp32 [Pantoea phage vB_PagS_Vid5]|uniref:Uncharacterized protein n=1 Tax=Pantoea phage vB_PagS_Vid5 TaxID=2099652 RepID=A0A2P1CKK8_9CAUD|nr:hypothetical protein FDJ45_gp032 [Pantoea phage vB_PagS_Vid5]AVJ51787.1 hypothetical protein Vid5_gp32 [Pantoea phage vB_PagS_Vid5]
MNVSRRRLLSWLPAVAAIPAIPALARLKPSVEKPVAPPEVKAEDFTQHFVVKDGQAFINKSIISPDAISCYNDKGVLVARVGKLDTRV